MRISVKGWRVGCNPTSSLSNFLVVVFIVLVIVLSSPFGSWLGWSVRIMFSYQAILYHEILAYRVLLKNPIGCWWFAFWQIPLRVLTRDAVLLDIMAGLVEGFLGERKPKNLSRTLASVFRMRY